MDYYKVLNVSKDATLDEIKKSYRRLALKFHPDRNPNNKEAEEYFKKVTAAYEILSDNSKRREFDETGAVGRNGRFKPSGVHDIFSTFFSNDFSVHDGEPGEHIVQDVKITLESVLTGCDVDVKINRKIVCESCHGSRGSMTTCSVCNGQGRTLFSGANMQVIRTCQSCNGRGQFLHKHCIKCSGTGYSGEREENIVVAVPPGIDNGMRITLKNKGQLGLMNGSNGHLYVVIAVEPHDFFERMSHGDILCKVPITYTQSVFGMEVEIPNLQGKLIKFRMPPNTQSGSKFRIARLGVPKALGPVSNKADVGDLIIEVRIDTPSNISDNHRIILEQLSNAEDDESYVQVKNFQNKLKDKYQPSRTMA